VIGAAVFGWLAAIGLALILIAILTGAPGPTSAVSGTQDHRKIDRGITAAPEGRPR
jgi:hypothetical protein